MPLFGVPSLQQSEVYYHIGNAECKILNEKLLIVPIDFEKSYTWRFPDGMIGELTFLLLDFVPGCARVNSLVKNENLPDLVKNRQSSVQSSVSGGVLGIIEYIITKPKSALIMATNKRITYPSFRTVSCTFQK